MATAGPSPQQIEYLNKVTREILAEFTKSITKEILRYSDRAKYYEFASKKGVEEGINSPVLQAGANKKGIEQAIAAGMLLSTVVVNGDPDKVEFDMREGGFVATIYDCPWKDAAPEVCMFMCDILGEVWKEAFPEAWKSAGVEFEPLVPNHMTSGDPFCRWIIKKKSETYKGPDSLGKTIQKLPMPDFPPKEQIMQGHSMMLATYWINSTLCFKTLNGPEKTNEVLLPNAKRIGNNFGSLLIDTNMLHSRDLATLGGFISLFGEGCSMQGKIISMEPDVFAKEISDCPFKNTLPEICKQWEAFFNGMLEVTNPELAFRCERMMTIGDKTCKWVVAKRQ